MNLLDVHTRSMKENQNPGVMTNMNYGKANSLIIENLAEESASVSLMHI